MKLSVTLPAIIVCLGFSAPVYAVQCNVPGGYATIQLAVDDVACSEILVAAGIFNSGVVVSRDVTIRGAGQITTDIQATITVNNDAVLSLRQLSVQFTGSHGVVLDSKFAELDGDNIEIAFTSGNGIHHGPTGADAKATLRNCFIHDNPRGILARVIDMDNCNVSFNSPLGGIQVGLGGIITNSTIAANENTGGTTDGGGILFDGPGGTTLTIEDSTISANFANNTNPATNTADGGGIMVREGFLFMRRSDVVGNVAGRWGGGVAAGDTFGVAVEIEDSYFNGNVAYSGGGAVGAGDRTEITNTLIEGNRAYYNAAVNSNGLAVGGGIYAFEDALTLTDSTVRLNVAQGEFGAISVNSGAGLYIDTDQPVTIEGSTINGNFAQVDGGGLYVKSTTTVTNTTIAANRANRDGGGVFGSLAPSLAHVTVVQNVADDDNTSGGGGGGFFGNAQVNHSLIGYNLVGTVATNNVADCAGGVVSTGYSFLSIGNGCASFDNGTAGNQIGTVASPIDLMLELPLSNNGGPTQTVALGPSSPARDGGATGCELATDTDQRNYSRVAQDGNGNNGLDGDPCDIGAFEVFSGCQAAPLVLTNITYSDAQTVQSETTLTTIGPVVIETTADIVFEASSAISLGNGFAAEGKFTAVTGSVNCT